MTAWTDAPCYGRRDDFVFDTDPKRTATVRRIESAKTLCAQCPHRQRCLDDELDVMRNTAGVTFGIYGGTSAKERRLLINPHRSRTGPFIAAPIVHGTPYGYQRCRKRPEGACVECKRANAQAKAEARARDGWRADKVVAWSRKWMRQLRAEAYQTSLALRDIEQRRTA